MRLTEAEIPFGFKMTELGPLPEEWRVVRLGEVGEVITGRTPSTARREYWDNGTIPFITPPDLDGRPIRRANRTITKEGLKESRPLPRGAVLVSCVGYIGKIGVTDVDLTVTNQQINAIIPKNMNNWFLAYALMHEDDLLANRARMTTVPILNKTNFEKVPIPLPPLSEQRAIAHVLRAVQEAKEATERVIAAMRELKKSLMRHLFTYGPVPADQTDRVAMQETEIGSFPAHWRVVRLGEVAEKPQYGYTASATKEPVGPRFLRITDIQNDQVNWSTVPFCAIEDDSLEKYQLRRGDILFARIGATTGKTYI
ncbi:restriction endonuclease subunit S, partial [Candidatus Parcubacteria bacterium]